MPASERGCAQSRLGGPRHTASVGRAPKRLDEAPTGDESAHRRRKRPSATKAPIGDESAHRSPGLMPPRGNGAGRPAFSAFGLRARAPALSPLRGLGGATTPGDVAAFRRDTSTAGGVGANGGQSGDGRVGSVGQEGGRWRSAGFGSRRGGAASWRAPGVQRSIEVRGVRACGVTAGERVVRLRRGPSRFLAASERAMPN
jgi:hypothetical protein